MRKFPKIKMALAEGGIGWVPYFLEKADFVYDHHQAWTGADFGDKLPSQVFREHVQTCFIDDVTGLRNRHQIGVDTITWEARLPALRLHVAAVARDADEVAGRRSGVPDDEIDMVTWENACRWYQFDPFEHRTREECTVGALRAQATDVDTTPREYGGFTIEAAVAKTLDKENATNFLVDHGTDDDEKCSAPPDADRPSTYKPRELATCSRCQAAPPPVSS